MHFYHRSDDPEVELADVHERDKGIRITRDSTWGVVAFVVMVAAIAVWVTIIVLHTTNTHH
jgi:hypothetical protein